MKLANNMILITGGTSGFGIEFASRFIALGNTVIITGRNAEKLKEAKQKMPKVHTIQSDVSKKEDIVALYDQIAQQFPELNMLINNASEMRKISLHSSYDLQDITREIEINLIGPIRMVQQFLPLLKKQEGALILNVTSGIALMPFPISPIYGASKSGLRSYTQSLRVQLKNTNISVMELVAPGSSTPLNDKFRDEEGFNANMLMAPERIIDAAINGIKTNKNEVYPGFSKLMHIMSRLAPKLLLSMAGKMGASTMYGTDQNKK